MQQRLRLTGSAVCTPLPLPIPHAALTPPGSTRLQTPCAAPLGAQGPEVEYRTWDIDALGALVNKGISLPSSGVKHLDFVFEVPR